MKRRRPFHCRGLRICRCRELFRASSPRLCYSAEYDLVFVAQEEAVLAYRGEELAGKPLKDMRFYSKRR